MVIIAGSRKESEIKEKVGFTIKDFIAVKGLKESFFEGETKAVHKVVGNKLVAKKLAEIVKTPLEEVTNSTRIVKDAPELNPPK